ncbi:hypothetical protein BH10PLA2_BH10PLA2_06550 [soil metagenome]
MSSVAVNSQCSESVPTPANGGLVAFIRPGVGTVIRFSTLALILLGLALRCYHYGRNPSVWHDEAALILNVICKSFGELLGPLYFAEAGPPLFLWLERVVRLWLGDGVFALRLLPFAASCIALLLVAFTARRKLPAVAVPIAVLLFACSRSMLWHASEAKPYAVDVALAALLPALSYGFMNAWRLEKRLIFFAIISPIAIALSFPGCFLMGGVALSMLPEVWGSSRKSAWLSFALLLATTGSAFLLLLLGPIHAQRCANMESCWVHAFAPWHTPRRVPIWALSSFLGMTRYCVDPVGGVLILPAIFGFVGLWKRGQQALVILLVSPIGLAFFAACLKAYPFDASRVVAFAAPALALGVAEGVTILAAWLYERSSIAKNQLQVWSLKLMLAGLVVVLVFPLCRAGIDVVKPWPRADVAAVASFVLQERKKTDPVVGNHWEHAYYFRSLRDDFVFWDGRPLPDVARCWLVITAGTEGESQLLIAIAKGFTWQTVREQRFAQCHALLLERIPAQPVTFTPPSN